MLQAPLQQNPLKSFRDAAPAAAAAGSLHAHRGYLRSSTSPPVVEVECRAEGLNSSEHRWTAEVSRRATFLQSS